MQNFIVIDVVLSSQLFLSQHRNTFFLESSRCFGVLQRFVAGANRNRTSVPRWLFTALGTPQKRAQTGWRNFIVSRDRL